jgi:hypothetical protein
MRSRYEIRAQRELEAAGYVVDYKARPFRVGHGYRVDLLGAFDLLAYKPGELRFVSVKAASHGVRRAHRAEVEALVFPEGCRKEIWTFRENGTVRKEVVR